jgi:hypothetical protein
MGRQYNLKTREKCVELSLGASKKADDLPAYEGNNNASKQNNMK